MPVPLRLQAIAAHEAAIDIGRQHATMAPMLAQFLAAMSSKLFDFRETFHLRLPRRQAAMRAFRTP